MSHADTDDLTVLGHPVEGPLDRLEVIPCSPLLLSVDFEGSELTALCPVTGQPDYYGYQITFKPAGRTLETKSLKHYLWTYRHKGVFAEDLAVCLLADVAAAVGAQVEVVLTQQRRGGITTTVRASGGPP
jgi:7-cyano-7-deazaguanine reductase